MDSGLAGSLRYFHRHCGLLTTLAMFTQALTTYGFLIVPVGLGWHIAAGIFLLRLKK